MKCATSYQKFFKDNTRTIVLYGGAGSGKSYAATQKILNRLIDEKGHKFLIIRKVAKTLKTSVYDLFISVINNENLRDDFLCTTSPMQITYKEKGNTILFAGLDDPEKIKSIADITGIFIEEATELAEKDYTQLNLRLRGNTSNYKQVILSFNPILSAHWLNRGFFIDKIYKASVYKTTYEDNPFIDPEYKKELENLKYQDEMAWKVYAKGEWGTLSEQTVFRKWNIGQTVNKNAEDYTTTDYGFYENVVCGIDYGYDHANVCLVIGFKKDQLHVIQEIHETEMLNIDFINVIKKRVHKWNELTFYCDNMPDKIVEMRRHGLTAIKVKKGTGTIAMAIDYLKRRMIYINADCLHTIQEMGAFNHIKDERSGHVIPDKFEDDGLFDCVAALRYSINSLMRKTKKLKAVPTLYGM